MMAELSFHLIDLAQNSYRAEARTIRVGVEEWFSRDLLVLTVEDDGRGMDEDLVERVQDPFFTTKGGKKVGLGIPLLKEGAHVCNGDFSIQSEVGRGTRVRASFQRSHWDRPPLGDLGSTFLMLLIGMEEANLICNYQNDRGVFSLSTEEIREQVGTEVSLSDPDIYRFLSDYVQEALAGLAPGDHLS